MIESNKKTARWAVFFVLMLFTRSLARCGGLAEHL